MDPELFRRVREIVLKARDLPPGEYRTTFLDRSCEGDAALRREVESLLAEPAEASILEPGRVADEMARNISLDDAPSADDHIGPYHLVEMIGEGGMGVVYHARQQEPIKRDVALKLIGWSLVSESMRARFLAEREALARMDHPNIARVLDAGETGRGRPYVVMELVRGEPITRYCDRNQLTIRHRVDLFARVCLAVHHAHQKGVLHRDLKPSNIMVEEVDGEAVPKLIDFGIAKSLKSDEALTVVGQLIGTPEYMSPEQAGELDEAIDTRSDIYSLGIVLHELLVGDLPVGRETLRGKPPTEVQRILREHEARRPSTKLRTLPAEVRAELGRCRDTSAARLAREVSGDLDWVTLKAVARDPRERYSSASEFAAELRRFLEHQPVEAGPPTRTAQFRKFVRRNRTAVTVATLVLAVLLAGVVSTSWQWRKATEQTQLAQTRLDAVNDFAIQFLNDVDRAVGELPSSTPVRRNIAQMAIERLDDLSASSGDSRGIEGALSRGYDRLSRIQLSLGELEDAMGSNQKSIEAARLLAERWPQSAIAWNQLGLRLGHRAQLSRRRGETQEGLALNTEALGIFQRVVETHPDYDLAVKNLALYSGNVGWSLYQLGRVPESREHLDRAATLMARIRDEEPDDHRGWGNLGSIQSRRGEVLTALEEVDAAEASLSDAVETIQAAVVRFPDRANLLERELVVAYGRFAQLLRNQERYPEALAMADKSRVISEAHVARFPTRMRERLNLATVLGDVGSIQTSLGDVSASRASYQAALTILESLREENPSATVRAGLAHAHRGLAMATMESGELPEMKQNLLAAYQLDRKLHEEDPENYRYARGLLHDQVLLAEYYREVGSEQRNLDSLEAADGWYLRGLELLASIRERGADRPELDEIDLELQQGKATNDSLRIALDSR